MTSVLLKPHLTEKSMRDAALPAFTFVVAPLASKSEVKHAVESLFQVHVLKLTTRIEHLSAKRTGSKRLAGPVSRRKLATVHLRKGESLALFEFKDEK